MLKKKKSCILLDIMFKLRLVNVRLSSDVRTSFGVYESSVAKSKQSARWVTLRSVEKLSEIVCTCSYECAQDLYNSMNKAIYEPHCVAVSQSRVHCK